MATRNYPIPCIVCGESTDSYVTLDNTMSDDEIQRRIAQTLGPVHTTPCHAVYLAQKAIDDLLNMKAQITKERLDIGIREEIDPVELEALALRRLAGQ